jgi:hypothetical protein
MPAEHSPHALPAARAWLLPLGSARPLRAELGQALARRTGGGDGGRPAAGLQQPLPEHRRAQRRDSPRVRRGAADLDGYEAPDRPAVEVAPRAGTGFAWTEAPRGMLWHRYEIDEEGTILHAQIVPPTSQLRAGRRAAATGLRAGDSQTTTPVSRAPREAGRRAGAARPEARRRRRGATRFPLRSRPDQARSSRRGDRGGRRQLECAVRSDPSSRCGLNEAPRRAVQGIDTRAQRGRGRGAREGAGAPAAAFGPGRGLTAEVEPAVGVLVSELCAQLEGRA